METAPTETILKHDRHGHTCMLTVRYRVDPLTLNAHLALFYKSRTITKTLWIMKMTFLDNQPHEPLTTATFP